MPVTRRAFVAVTATSLAMFGLPAVTAGSAAAETAPKRMMSGWLPYWTTQASMEAFLANSDLFSDISPFWHDAGKSTSTASGVTIKNHSLGYGTRASNLAALKGHGAEVWPSITDGTGAGYMSSVLRNTSKRAALVSQIVNLVNSNGYDGIDLDFEKFAFSDGSSTWSKTRPAWVTFVAELSAQLHANGKKLSVAVPPEGVAGSDYWVYDWKSIGPHIDKLRIMAYDYSWSTPGPIGGPLSWVHKVAAYAVSTMPGSKVQLGTPTYGRDWVKSKSGSGCPSTAQKVYDSKQIGSVLGVGDGSWKRDAASQERYFNYTVKYNGGACTVSRSAWVPDATTVIERAKIASQYGLAGLATWTIGGEQAGQWGPLRDIARTMPFATNAGGGSVGQQVNFKVSKKVVRRGGKVKVSGKLTPARSGAKVKVQRLRAGKWVNLKTVRTSAAGNYKTTVKVGAKAKFRVAVPKTGRYLKAVSGARLVKIR